MDIIKGHLYTALRSVKRQGQRIEVPMSFMAARTMTPEPFFRDGQAAPDQDRVFAVSKKFGSAPELIITGSLKELE